MVRLVSLHIVKEVVCEDSLLSSNEVLLLLVLNVTEVYPAAKRESTVAGQTFEGLIDLHLVKGSVFECATGH